MSEHPDYTQFRRDMFIEIGLPVNSHVGRDWRKMPLVADYWTTAGHLMQTPEEIKDLGEYPIEESLYWVPNWTWLPEWAWKYAPKHLELWYHIYKEVLSEQHEV